MYPFLLKKALPFALTFVFGAALSGLVGLFGGSEQKKFEWTSSTSTYDFGSRCRMRRHNLVAVSKPLVINFIPRVSSKDWLAPEGRVRVSVTFGADGKVQEVKPLASWVQEEKQSLVRVKAMWDAVDEAARGIDFSPETVDGVPVTVTREVELEFGFDAVN
jgi:hypothetical protein